VSEGSTMQITPNERPPVPSSKPPPPTKPPPPSTPPPASIKSKRYSQSSVRDIREIPITKSSSDDSSSNAVDSHIEKDLSIISDSSRARRPSRADLEDWKTIDTMMEDLKKSPGSNSKDESEVDLMSDSKRKGPSSLRVKEQKRPAMASFSTLRPQSLRTTPVDISKSLHAPPKKPLPPTPGLSSPENFKLDLTQSAPELYGSSAPTFSISGRSTPFTVTSNPRRDLFSEISTKDKKIQKRKKYNKLNPS